MATTRTIRTHQTAHRAGREMIPVIHFRQTEVQAETDPTATPLVTAVMVVPVKTGPFLSPLEQAVPAARAETTPAMETEVRAAMAARVEMVILVTEQA